MKHVKTFEAKTSSDDIHEDTIDLLRDVMNENPNNKTHDFYMFIASPDFIETKGGLYKKSISIENMVRIQPNKESITAINSLEMRARYQADSNVYHIWLPKEIRSEIEGKGINIEPNLVELINKHKMKGSDDHGRQVFKDVKQRREDMKKYNL